MKDFEYFAPETLEEAIRLLDEYGEAARPLAGGTDLLVFMRDWRVTPDVVVDLKRIPTLYGVEELPDGGVRFGALVPMYDLERDGMLQAKYPHLVSALREVGSIQIRNLATVGGNVCNASPAADTPPALLTLQAQVRLEGPQGERILPLQEFFRGPGQTVLRRGEVLTHFLLPPPRPRSGGCYIKLANRRAMDIAFVGVAAWVALNGDDTIAEARIALGAVAPTPIRAEEAEAILRGQPLEERVLREAAGAAEAASKPITDQRASAEYRRMMVEVLTRRALLRAAEQAKRNP